MARILETANCTCCEFHENGGDASKKCDYRVRYILADRRDPNGPDNCSQSQKK